MQSDCCGFLFCFPGMFILNCCNVRVWVSRQTFVVVFGVSVKGCIFS